jgi:hypothetical protein
VETTLYEGGYTITNLIRKEEKLPMQVVHYVHLCCTRPVNACYSTVYAQVLAAMWACNHVVVFRQQLKQLLQLYVKRGFNRHRLLDKVVWAMQHYHSIVPTKSFDMAAVASALRRD